MWLGTLLSWVGSWFVGGDGSPSVVTTPPVRTAYSIAQDRVSEAPERIVG